VLVVLVDVDVDVVIVVDVDVDVEVDVLVEVDVDVDVDVDVVLVVVSHPLHVLAHCCAIESLVKHNPTTTRRSHCTRGKLFLLSAHL
jgi:hypothetical protein